MMLRFLTMLTRQTRKQTSSASLSPVLTSKANATCSGAAGTPLPLAPGRGPTPAMWMAANRASKESQVLPPSALFVAKLSTMWTANTRLDVLTTLLMLLGVLVRVRTFHALTAVSVTDPPASVHALKDTPVMPAQFRLFLSKCRSDSNTHILVKFQIMCIRIKEGVKCDYQNGKVVDSR